MSSIKVADLLEKYKLLEQRSDALRMQVARDDARRESDQRQYDEIMQQLQEMFQTRDIDVIRKKIEQEKEVIQVELSEFEAALANAEAQRAACQRALAEIDAEVAPSQGAGATPGKA